MQQHVGDPVPEEFVGVFPPKVLLQQRVITRKGHSPLLYKHRVLHINVDMVNE